MEINGSSHKNILLKKLIYMILKKYIDKHVIKGIKTLSLYLYVDNNSVIVAITEMMKISIIFKLEKNNMVKVTIKKAVLPSNDLLNNFVLPNIIPITAANESDILITNRPKKAISFSNKHATIKLPINTNEAPVSCFFSFSLVKMLKNL